MKLFNLEKDGENLVITSPFDTKNYILCALTNKHYYLNYNLLPPLERHYSDLAVKALGIHYVFKDEWLDSNTIMYLLSCDAETYLRVMEILHDNKADKTNTKINLAGYVCYPFEYPSEYPSVSQPEYTYTKFFPYNIENHPTLKKASTRNKHTEPSVLFSIKIDKLPLNVIKMVNKYYPGLIPDLEEVEEAEEIEEQKPQEEMQMTFMDELYARIDGIVGQLDELYNFVEDHISEINS